MVSMFATYDHGLIMMNAILGTAGGLYPSFSIVAPSSPETDDS
jgi:hypothetical protein